ncbi:hypothetical protein L2E82_10795 [Cichorium intybus]|uniref:Uncharacterized protein n=1 Tax=Cichorium intybus TaxID=13427 RepID=A0ACB9GB21_CICIN|nr:hypothetical protein L2E82_10795 [Cichorium intybus]
MPRHMTTVTNYPSSSSQQHSFLKDQQSNCVTEECIPNSKNLENSNKEKIDEEIEMEKSPGNIIIKNDFNKIIIRNPNVADMSNMTSEPSCSNTKSYEDTSQHNFSNNPIRISFKKLKVNHEETDSLNDSLFDSSPREIFQKGKGKNLTKQGVKPILNRKDLRSPRSLARFEQKKCFYTQKRPEANSTFVTPIHTLRSTPSTPRNFGGYVTFGNDANDIIKGYGVLTNGNFTIQKVAYVLGLKHNLISVGQLVSTGLPVEFDNEFSYIMTGEMVRGMPLLRFNNENLCAACALGKQKKKPHKSITDSSITHPLELLHMDLYGPSIVASLNHKKYILVIVDDYT